MAVLNLTPDSFFADSRLPTPDHALASAERALEAGAHILDLGAESTRPGATPLDPEAEWSRLRPALDRIRHSLPNATLSVDTRHALTARRALDAGADILNDVTGFEDSEMLAVAASSRCGLIAMHHRGAFDTMHRLPPLADPLGEVSAGLATILDRIRSAGLDHERVVLDPGFGFGKNLDENFPILRGLDSLQQFGCPVLVGVSRKSFLRNSPAQLASERLAASLAALTAALLAGAHIVRVHDCAASAEAARLADCLIAPVNVRK